MGVSNGSICYGASKSAASQRPDQDAALVAQEKADGVAIVFAKPSAPWVMPMKNVMNPTWQSIGAEGVNDYTFAGPNNLLRSYSERSEPRSPYYQAWVGAYVTKRRDGTLPQDLPAWAKQVTELDQRSWLAAMGDPQPGIRSFHNVTLDGYFCVLARRDSTGVHRGLCGRRFFS